MTSQSPRIYIYKITFEEVLYYYYGVHKEKKFDEYYMGSPVTHKRVWDFYTPKKQILEIFPYTDDGWIEANEVENRLIKPFYNTDKWCLNENCGGLVSLDVRRKNGKQLYQNKIGFHAITRKERIKIGKKVGKKSYQLKLGAHARTKKQMTEDGKKGGQKTYELGIGIHGISKEQMIENSRKGGQRAQELGLGIHSLTKEQRIENARKAGKRSHELGLGIHAQTLEEKRELGKKIYEQGLGFHAITKEERREIGKKTASQKWQCTETGFITNSGNLSRYQKARGIDTSKRIRIE